MSGHGHASWQALTLRFHAESRITVNMSHGYHTPTLIVLKLRAYHRLCSHWYLPVCYGYHRLYRHWYLLLGYGQRCRLDQRAARAQ